MIERFSGEYSFLSNMILIEPFQYGQLTFKSVENFYQAMKSMNFNVRSLISEKDPKPSKSWMGEKIRKENKNRRVDWDDIKIDVMEFGLRIKFNQIKFREKLIATGTEELVEGNYWNDVFWGVDLKDKEKPGQNQLGRLLMKIRDEINANPTVDLFEQYKPNKQRPTPGKIIVINVKKELSDIYVGRGTGLGNPHSAKNGEYKIEDSMRLYQNHLTKYVLGDTSSKGYPMANKILSWIQNGHDVKIGCSCKKFRSDHEKFKSDATLCHADIIKAELLNLIH
jgi:ribA/ribD-fused uncharacterized protein